MLLQSERYCGIITLYNNVLLLYIGNFTRLFYFQKGKKMHRLKKTVDMTEGPFLKKMILFAIPIITVYRKIEYHCDTVSYKVYVFDKIPIAKLCLLKSQDKQNS